MNCFRARKCLHRCCLLTGSNLARRAKITVSSTTLPPAMWQKIIVRLNNRPVVGTSTLTWTFSLFGSTTIYCLNCLCAKTQIIFSLSCPGNDDVIWLWLWQGQILRYVLEKMMLFEFHSRLVEEKKVVLTEAEVHHHYSSLNIKRQTVCTCNQSFREKLCSTEHYFCWRPATGSKLHNMMGASINLESIPGVELWTLSQQPRKNILIPCNICANFFRSRNQFWLLTVLCQLSSENQNDLPIAWWGRLCLKVSTFIR